ncbi:hypothetical protein ACFRFL_44500 [Streptomyces sp. NPDC056708]|uniref:hypothetical protein n=1 Tax=unclassified Streptomyces TaxID=2593676 RepID=UPI0036B1C99D
MQVTRLAVAAQAAADPTTLDAARREVTTELLAARRPVVQPMSGSNPVLARVGCAALANR